MKYLKSMAGLTLALFTLFGLTACSDDKNDTFLVYNQGLPIQQNISVAGTVCSIELKFNIAITEISNIVVDNSVASIDWEGDNLVISFPENNTNKEIIIPVTISCGNNVKTFNIRQKVKNKVQSAYSYYSLQNKGERKNIEVNLTTDSKCSCAMVYDGEMFASIVNYKQDGKHISIELDIDSNSGVGRVCGLRISPEDGDEVIIGLWQQPHAFSDNETFNVHQSGKLGVMLGEDVANYTHLRKIAITGSLNSNDIAVIKKLFNKYTYNGLTCPPIDIDLSNANISYSDNKGYYEQYGGIGTILENDKVQTSRNTIPSQLFQQSGNLISIILPSSVTDIEERAFAYCMNLESVSLPIDCKRIGNYAFYNCSKLSNIVSSYKDDYCRITSIGDYAFGGIGQLDYLILPEELTGLTSRSLLGFRVNNLYLLKQTPPDINIYGISEGCTLYVPKGCIDVYRSSTQWGKFTDIKELTAEIY